MIWLQEVMVPLQYTLYFQISYSHFWAAVWICDALRLWVGTELASLGATLQEHKSSDSWAIVRAKRFERVYATDDWRILRVWCNVGDGQINGCWVLTVAFTVGRKCRCRELRVAGNGTSVHSSFQHLFSLLWSELIKSDGIA